jgi:ubiquinone/menaquinone biosynthesis C-methylase UbiE
MSHEELPPPFAMMKMITGFWVSQIVGSVARFDVADAIATGVNTSAAIADRAKTDRAAMERLLTAAASLGLVTRDAEGRFATTPLGATLRSGVPGSMRDMAIAQTAPGHWLPWGRLHDAVRTGERMTTTVLGREIWDHYAQNPEEGATFDLAMSGFSSLLAPAIAAAIELPKGARVVDVGGSRGELLMAILGANPGASGVLLDLPPVVARAKARIEQLGLAERVELVGGDFFGAAPSADAYVLKHILHDWNDAECEKILGNVARAMRPGGKVYVVELVLPETDQPGLAPLMDINMMVMLTGRERTEREYAALFARAGLSLTRTITTKSPFSVLEARAA